MEVHFKVHGRHITATKEQVEAALQDVEPGKIRVHAVEVAGRVFPLRQAFAAAFGLDVQDCAIPTARRVLGKLGYTLKTSDHPRNRREAEVNLKRAMPHRKPGFGPEEDEWIELGPIHVAWYAWERWEDIAEHGVAIIGIPKNSSGIYEARIVGAKERLTIGRASDLRTRILHGLIRGSMPHPAGDKIRADEDLAQVEVRWALTSRPAAIEEELHQRHVERFGYLPKHTLRT